jgi:hypothetical protein
MYPHLTPAQQEQVVAALKAALCRAAGSDPE